MEKSRKGRAHQHLLKTLRHSASYHSLEEIAAQGMQWMAKRT